MDRNTAESNAAFRAWSNVLVGRLKEIPDENEEEIREYVDGVMDGLMQMVHESTGEKRKVFLSDNIIATEYSIWLSKQTN